MIYVTGDMHGEKRFSQIKEFINCHHDITYLIILGDFGAIWDKNNYIIQELSYYPLTILFIDGNHENFDLLNSYPEEDWAGGKIHRISNNIFHLMRGNIFQIEGKTFFAFGGAVSRDRTYRHEGISWWQQEEMSETERQLAVDRLDTVNYVDFVLTHCGNMQAVQQLNVKIRNNRLNVCKQSVKISKLLKDTVYSKWFCGHYHVDEELDKYIFLYKKFYRLCDMEDEK